MQIQKEKKNPFQMIFSIASWIKMGDDYSIKYLGKLLIFALFYFYFFYQNYFFNLLIMDQTSVF